MATINNRAVTITVSDYRQLFTELNKIEPGLTKAMRTEIRAIAVPLRNSVKQGIPKSAPLIGIQRIKIGRLGWGEGKPATSVNLDTRRPSKKKREGTALARLVVPSAASALTDMAGKSGRFVGKRPLAKGNGSYSAVVPSGKYKGEVGYRYTYRNGVVAGRIHRNTGAQGRGLIRGLNRYGQASRWVYKNVDKALPRTRIEIIKVVDKYIAIVNRK